MERFNIFILSIIFIFLFLLINLAVYGQKNNSPQLPDFWQKSGEYTNNGFIYLRGDQYKMGRKNNYDVYYFSLTAGHTYKLWLAGIGCQFKIDSLTISGEFKEITLIPEEDKILEMRVYKNDKKAEYQYILSFKP